MALGDPGGAIGSQGLDILFSIRTQQQASDGREDYEDDGLSTDEDEMELRDVEEDEELMFA